MSECSHSKPSYDPSSTEIELTLTFNDAATSKFKATYTRITYRGRHQSINDWNNENCYSEYYGAYNCSVSEIVGDRTLDRGRIRNTSTSKFHDPHHHCGEVCAQLSGHIDRARARTSNMFGQVINEDEEKLAISLFNSFPELDNIEVIKEPPVFYRRTDYVNPLVEDKSVEDIMEDSLEELDSTMDPMITLAEGLFQKSREPIE